MPLNRTPDGIHTGYSGGIRYYSGYDYTDSQKGKRDQRIVFIPWDAVEG